MSDSERAKTRNIFNNGVQSPAGTAPIGDRIRVPTPQAQRQVGGSEAPQLPPEVLAQQPTFNEVATLPALQSEEDATRLARILRERGREGIGDDRFDRSMRQLRIWREGNPQQTPEESFTSKFIDTSPTKSSREAFLELGDYSGVPRGFDIEGNPKPERVPDPGSRDAILAQEEANGLDTLSGFGGFGDVLGLATEFNSPRARVAYINGVVTDELEKAGIFLPEGMPAVAANDNLGELMFLKPTEEGMARWTLADGELFRPADIGAVADLPELLSAVGAGIGNFASPIKGGSMIQRGAQNVFGKTGNPFISEFIGDLGGRKAGIMLEFMLNAGEVTEEEYQEALDGAAGQSLFDTVVGRTIGRAGDRIVNGKSLKTGADENVSDIERNIAESADVMDEVNRLSGGVQEFTAAEASNSTRALQEQAGREATLSSGTKNVVEQQRIRNMENLQAANNRIASDAAGVDSPSYDPPGAVVELNEARDAFGKVQVGGDPAVGGRITYSYGGDVASDGNVLLAGDGQQMLPGLEVTIDHKARTVTLDNMIQGEKFKGGTVGLIDRVIQDTAEFGYEMKSSPSMSKDARNVIAKMEKAGFGFTKNADGSLTVETMPGEMVASPEIANANFDRTMLESELEDMMAILPAAQQFAVDANNKLNGVIGWSDQAQTSKYSVENKPSNTLSQQVRKLQNRVTQSLTGVEASEADSLLGTIIRREVDEDGDTVLAGLAGPELDVGNLLRARTKLADIAEKTGDPEVARVVDTIDTLMKNGTIWTEKGNPIADSTRAAINGAVDGTRTAQGHVDRATASINASSMFKQNQNGEFINTNLRSMRSLMANDARFITHMKPILDENPAIRDSAEEALHQLYRDEVFEGGWSRRKHDAWFTRYAESAKVVLGEQGADRLKRYELQEGSAGMWANLRARSQASVTRMVEKSGLPPEQLNPKNLLDSFSKMQRGRARQFMTDVRNNNPALAANIESTLVEQTRRKLDDLYFNTDKGIDALGTADNFRKWFRDNEPVLREVHGDQYVTDMQSVVNAHLIDARRSRVQGNKVESQGDVLRVTRSFLGPLSRPQRQLTAGNYVLQRRMAKKVLEVYSDPASLRALKATKGLGARSEAGIALLTRLGIFEAAGIQNDRNGVPSPEKVEEFYRWMDETSRRGLEDANVEQEK